MSQYWLFQGNPKYSRVTDGIRELDEMYWLVTRYATAIAVGDGVLVWVAGKAAGIYAIAQVIQPVQFVDKPPDLAYWLMPARAIGRFYAPIRFIQKFVESPLYKELVLHDSILRHMQVIRTPHGTNFKLTMQEWQRSQELLLDNNESS
jgi:hypothetical protein